MSRDSSPKIISLEFCRFIAAFCVMVDHQISFIDAQHLTSRPVLGGFDLPPILPVLFFFVLSGFVMMTAHHQDFGRLERIPRFAWRRVCRIYPVYWLTLSVWLYCMWPLLTPHYIFKAVTLYPFQTGFVELNPPAWSLRFELSFYFMFGLALLPYVGRVFLALWILLVCMLWFPDFAPIHLLVGVTHFHPAVPAALSWHFFGLHEVYFFAGLLAGFVFLRAAWHRALLWVLLGAGLVAVVAYTRLAAWGFGYPSIHQTPFFALGLASCIFALGALEQSGALPLGAGVSRWGGRLGAMSYPLYLFHPVLIYLMSVGFYFHPAWRVHFTPGSLFALFLAATLSCTAAITFLVDRPLQRFLRKLA